VKPDQDIVGVGVRPIRNQVISVYLQILLAIFVVFYPSTDSRDEVDERKLEIIKLNFRVILLK